ncbi:hypothetical protein TNCV_2704281 [Trichonephila clavipes]|nr:hypothetical protein TNCV_2704281 [Trichonephila clavipes]
MRGRIIGKIEEGRKITNVAREFDIAHSVVSRLWKSFKTTGMCSRRHGEVVLEVRRLQKKRIYRPISKRNGRTTAQRVAKSVSCCLRKADLPKNCCQTFEGRRTYARRPVVCIPLTRQHRTAVCNGVVTSITIGLNRTGHAYYSQMRVRFSLSSDCRRQLIWREWYCLSSRNIRKRTDIRHAVSWCGPAS